MHVSEVHLKTGTYTQHPAGPITVGTKRKILVFTPPRSPENAIPKARKIFYNK